MTLPSWMYARGSLLTAFRGREAEQRMVSDERLKIDVHDSIDALERLSSEWDELLRTFPYSTPFCTWEWLVPWWRAFGGDDCLRVLSFRDKALRLVALAPL